MRRRSAWCANPWNAATRCPSKNSSVVRSLNAYAEGDRRGALAREAQRPGQLEGQQLVGGRHQHVAAAVQPAQGEVQVAQGAEPLLLAGGAVADHAGGERRSGGGQVALQGGVVAVVGHDQGRLDHTGAGQVGQQVVDEGATAHLDQRLGRVGEQRADAGPVAGGEQDRVHGSAPWGMVVEGVGFPRTRQLIELDPHRCHGIQILHNPIRNGPAGTSRVESPLIGARIKALREQRELTQDSVARLFGFKDRQTVSAIETGDRGVTAEELLLAVEKLGAPLEYFTDPFLLVPVR